MKIVVYSKPDCTDCRKAKMFFNHYKMSYTEKDIEADPQAMDELMELGSMKLSTIVINGQVFIGFAENMYAIKELLNLN